MLAPVMLSCKSAFLFILQTPKNRWKITRYFPPIFLAGNSNQFIAHPFFGSLPPKKSRWARLRCVTTFNLLKNYAPVMHCKSRPLRFPPLTRENNDTLNVVLGATKSFFARIWLILMKKLFCKIIGNIYHLRYRNNGNTFLANPFNFSPE